MIKALIFDMDGVLVDSEPLQVEAERWVCRKNKIDIPLSEWRHFKGKTSRDIFDYIINHFTDGSFSVDDLIKEKKSYYLRIGKRSLKLFPGVKNLLGKSKFYIPKTALTTSSERPVQRMVFDRFDLHGYFDVVVTGDEVNKGKPHPEPYLKTIQKIGIRPHQAVVIEDSDNGIIAAKTAGCKTIAITNSFPRKVLLAAGADYVVDKCADIHPILSGLTGGDPLKSGGITRISDGLTRKKGEIFP